jgi:uncharacterized protein (DUF58 family)
MTIIANARENIMTKSPKIPKEIFSHVRRIEIKTGKLVNEVFAGQYNSVFKGRGIEFDEVREYAPGDDDIRNIDWNVTARMGHPYIKRYREERELTVMLVVDMSASLQFGTQYKYKSEIAAELASIIAFSAIKNNDKVGMIIFTNTVEKYILPKKGRSHILRLIREILYFKPQNKTTNIKIGLEYLNDILKRKAVVFLISDFESGGYEKILRITNKRHDLINIILEDVRETNVPNVGIMNVKDNETEEFLEIDTRENFQNFFKERYNAKKDEREKLFKSSNIDFINISTDKSYVDPLIKFFKYRERKFR